MRTKKLSTSELALVKESARNRIKEHIAYSITAIFLVFIAPVFPFSRRGSKVLPKNWYEYRDMIPMYALIIGLIILYTWVRSNYLRDILFKRKFITAGDIKTWITKKNNYGDTTYELIVKTASGTEESYQTFEKHLQHFNIGAKYQFHVSRHSKVLVNMAKIRNSNKGEGNK